MRSSWEAWRIVVLLFLFMLINFADKIIIGLAGVPIMIDLSLSSYQFGQLGSAFFYLFSASAVVVGVLSSYVPTKRILLVLALVWAIVQFPMVGEVGLVTLFVCRVILGAGEGPAFAMTLLALYKWFPDERRALPTAIVAQGATFGVIVAVPALNWLIVNHTWHSAFGALGIVGLAWCAAWMVWGKEGPLDTYDIRAPREPAALLRDTFSTLLQSPTFFGCCITTFGAYWVVSTALTWLTPFIVNGLKYPQSAAGFATAAPWALGAIVMLATGWLSQVMMARGVSSTLARGTLGSAPLVCAGLILMAIPLANTPGLKLGFLTIGIALSGTIYVVCSPIIAELVSDHRRGALISVYSAFYGLAGIAAPATMGRYVGGAETQLEGFQAGFSALGFILIASGLAGLVLIRPERDRCRVNPGGL